MAANYELGVGKYCFGEFCCSHCGREWESSKAWRDFGQECSKCGSKIKPHNLLALCWYYCVQCEHVWKYKGMEEEVECNVCSEIAFVFETHVEFQEFCTALNLSANGSGVINQERAHQQDKCEKCILLGNGRLCYESGNENLKNPHIPVRLNNGHSVNLKPTKVTISSISEVRLSNTLKLLKVKKLMANDENVTRKTKQSISSIIGPLSLERASTKMLTFEERREEEARKKQKEAEERQMESEQRRQREADQRRLEAEQRRQKEAEQRWQMEAEHCRKMEAEQRRKMEAEQRRKMKAEQRRKMKAEQSRKMKAEQRRKIEAEQRRLEAEQRRQEEAEERRQREAEERRQREAEQRRQMESEQRRQRDAAERERYNKNGNANNGDGMVVAVAGAVVLIGVSILRSIFKF